jgi:hypothetical protein
MLLDIAYSQKLPDHSAVKADDIEGTLYKFIPPGELYPILFVENEAGTERLSHF